MQGTFEHISKFGRLAAGITLLLVCFVFAPGLTMALTPGTALADGQDSYIVDPTVFDLASCSISDGQMDVPYSSGEAVFTFQKNVTDEWVWDSDVSGIHNVTKFYLVDSNGNSMSISVTKIETHAERRNIYVKWGELKPGTTYTVGCNEGVKYRGDTIYGAPAHSFTFTTVRSSENQGEGGNGTGGGGGSGNGTGTGGGVENGGGSGGASQNGSTPGSGNGQSAEIANASANQTLAGPSETTTQAVSAATVESPNTRDAAAGAEGDGVFDTSASGGSGNGGNYIIREVQESEIQAPNTLPAFVVALIALAAILLGVANKSAWWKKEGPR